MTSAAERAVVGVERLVALAAGHEERQHVGVGGPRSGLASMARSRPAMREIAFPRLE